jgi:hypothetical protein
LLTDLSCIVVGVAAAVAVGATLALAGRGRRRLPLIVAVGVVALAAMTVWAWHTNRFPATFGPFVVLGPALALIGQRREGGRA